MSVFPAPANTLPIFNPSDILTTPEELATAHDETNGEIDTSSLVKKSGDNMFGKLNLPSVGFDDNTTQYSAVTPSMFDILDGLIISNGVYTIPKLRVDEIVFQNDGYGTAPQVNNFLLADKQAISSNTGNVNTLLNRTTDISYNNNTTIIENDFQVVGEAEFDCAHFSTVGTIGCEPGEFVLNAHDENHIRIDSGFSKQIHLKSSKITFGRQSNPAYFQFHGHVNMYLNTNHQNLIITTGPSYSTTFENDVSFDSNVYLNTLTINSEVQNFAFSDARKTLLETVDIRTTDISFDDLTNTTSFSNDIKFSDNSIQTTGFTTALKDKVILNESKIGHFTFNANDISITKQLACPSIRFSDGSIQTTAFHETLISTTNEVLYLKSGVTSEEPMYVSASSIILTDFYNLSYGEIGPNANVQMEIKSTNAQGISLNCGGPFAGVNIIGNSLTFDGNSGNSINMNGETQDRCFTESLYQKLVNNPREYGHSSNLGWGFIDRVNALAHSTSYDTMVKSNIGHKLANINLDPLQVFFQSNGNWNKGPMTVHFKYTVNYDLLHCQITRLRSRIVVEGSTNFYTGAWIGVHYKPGHWDSNHNVISYSDSAHITVDDNTKIFIETDYDMQTSTTASGLFDLTSVIEIVQI